MAGVQDLLAELERVRVGRPSDLQASLGVSRATLPRLVAKAGDRVCRIGRRRSVRYALTRTVEGLGARLPILRVGVDGRASASGTLHLLWAGQHWWERSIGSGDLFAGLPPPLADMAPQGYMGRAVPSRFPELQLPPRITDWSDDHRLIALARRGEDCVGDLIVGEESFSRFMAWSPAETQRSEYPALADRSALDAPGSSAGGEQPKFGAFSAGRHMLVKFASAADTPSARRWRDLLWSEWRALRMMAEAGRVASRAEWVDADGGRYLELERFDRVGERGRRPVVTLGALDDEYFGKRDSWTAAARRLTARPFSLPVADAANLRWLDAFGQLIGNTDRHFGNVTCLVRPDGTLRLAPAYDMLPMILAPVGDAVPARTFKPAPPAPENLDVWPDAARWAVRYWAALLAEERLDPSVRAFAEGAGAAVEAMMGRVEAGR